MAHAHASSYHDTNLNASLPTDTQHEQLQTQTQRRRQRKARQEHLVVADLVQIALHTKQREAEQVAAAARPQRRKRAPRKNKHKQVAAAAAVEGNVASCITTVLLENLVLPDDVDDSDEYEDIVTDLERDFAAFGPLVSLVVERATGAVRVAFADNASAHAAVAARHGKRFGGRMVVARIIESAPTSLPDSPALTPTLTAIAASPDQSQQRKTATKRRSKTKSAVLRARAAVETDKAKVAATDSRALAQPMRFVVRQLFTRDDVVDPDERDDLVDDARCDFEAFGDVLSLAVHEGSESDSDGANDSDRLRAGDMEVAYRDPASASAAFAAYHNRVFGGRTVTCTWLPQAVPSLNVQAETVQPSTSAVTPTWTVNVPPIAPDVVDILTQLLARLAQLQARAHHNNAAHDKRSQRLVLGLREVERRVAVRKLRLVVVATDVDTCDALDDQLCALVAAAERTDVPVAFALTRRQLGRAVDKRVRVSCVGVCAIDGANDLFADVVRHLAHPRTTSH